jgi:uncharacterized protein with LGFP repeats
MTITPGEIADRVVARATGLFARRVSRRSLLSSTAVVGSAIVTSGFDYILRPGTAYASVCGHSSTCSSGWTAMCCTINEGVNRCPPGSFAGGWWKAADANLCGGKARYYVDCQGMCTECGCHGSHYCGQHCWNCKPHCAHHKTCDQRRVCHNLFRYGQCDRHIHCSGPVLCRAISCTPPWEWANCSTTAATDNATVTHSAPCLPRWTPIAERYKKLGSQGSVLGATVYGERDGHRGRVQHYVHGRMYSSTHTGPHYLTGRVASKYVALDESGSPLGLPVTDVHETSDGDAHTATFEHGAIYQRFGHAGHALWGSIWSAWKQAKSYTGPLGYPLTDVTEAKAGDGRYAHFQGGVIYQGDGHRAHVLAGSVAVKYKALHYEAGVLGYPTTDERRVTSVNGTSAVEMRFENGAIEATAANVHAVWGPIYTAWWQDGGATGPLGLPITDVVTVDSTHTRCDFENGYAVYDSTSDQVTITMT